MNKKYTKTQSPKYDTLKDDSTETEFLSREQLLKVMQYDFSFSPMFEAVRDVFVFTAFTGFLWIDLKHLDFTRHFETDANGAEWIIKPRNKTGEQQIIPFFPEAKAILEKYDYKLPLGVEGTHNKELKSIMKLLGINSKITIRCGRKTAGMVWLNSNVTLEVVSKMLGHKNIGTTQKHYAKIIREGIYKGTLHLFSNFLKIEVEKEVEK